MLKEVVLKNRTVQTIIGEMAEIAGYLWQRGWAERNAGNISVNISDILRSEKLRIPDGPLIRFPGNKKYSLGGDVFIITGTGTRMRDLARDPEENICVIRIDDSGRGFSHLCRCRETTVLQPSSELPAHLSIQEMFLDRKNGMRVLMHAHATELIALTHIPGLKSEAAINRILWGMHPETMIFVPAGVGFVPFTLPGTTKIADATRKELETHEAVIWEKHGVFASGKTIPEAFDTLDLLSKSAQIYLYCRQAGIEPEGLTDKQLLDIRKNYGLG